MTDKKMEANWDAGHPGIPAEWQWREAFARFALGKSMIIHGICEDLEWLVDKAVSTNLIKKLRKLVLPENGEKKKKHDFIIVSYWNC